MIMIRLQNNMCGCLGKPVTWSKDIELFISTESLWIKDEDSLNCDISIQTRYNMLNVGGQTTFCNCNLGKIANKYQK
jgi:hypothetical protein